MTKAKLIISSTVLVFACCVAFELPSDASQVRSWVARFEEHEEAQQGLIARAQKKPNSSTAVNQNSPKRTPLHSISVQLLKTNLYTLNGDVEWDSLCIKYTNWGEVNAYLSMVYDVDPTYQINLDVAQFQKEILPELLRRCSPPTSVRIKIFIKGVRIGRGESLSVGEEYGVDEEPPLGEAPLIIFLFSRQNGNWRRDVDWQRISVDQHQAATWSLEGYRSRLKRQKLEKAESIARQNEEYAKAKEAELRQKKADQAERIRIAKIESKDGIEPSFEDLAASILPFLGLASVNCPNPADREWCEWSPDVWVRLKGGKRISCAPVVVGKDYHCEFNMEFECMVRGPRNQPVNNPVACGIWTILSARILRVGAKRTLSGWMLYSLEK